MSFSADWLSLREPADRAARDPALLAAAARAAISAAGGGTPVIVDLGCGTGATARAFAAHLPEARWRLVDADAALLDIATARTGGSGHRLNLADLDVLPLAGAHLVTASALLDLMPGEWIAGLVSRLASRRLGFYAALSYDGVMEWTPPDTDDVAVTAAFNAHQRSDKGVGAALGPEAAAVAAGAFRQAGFDAHLAESPWRLGPDQTALHGELVDAIADAAAESGCAAAGRWRQARRAAVAYSSAVIGHRDLLALPGDTSQSNRMSEPSP